MSWFDRITIEEYDRDEQDDSSDPDLYGEGNQIGDPGNPVWDGSDVHSNPSLPSTSDNDVLPSP